MAAGPKPWKIADGRNQKNPPGVLERYTGGPSKKRKAGIIIMTIYEKINTELNNRKDRSAWDKGVTLYAFELLEQLEESSEYNGRDPKDWKECKEWMLNGANDWLQYSWGGCSLIYNYEIAERLCCPSELKKTKNGERRPNANEEWLDTQARALSQACKRVISAYKKVSI